MIENRREIVHEPIYILPDFTVGLYIVIEGFFIFCSLFYKLKFYQLFTCKNIDEDEVLVSMKGNSCSERITEIDLPEDIYNLTIALMHESNCTTNLTSVDEEMIDKRKD